jgi:hypothetical protein
MEQTGNHVVFVRDGEGNIVHTHEVVYFAGASELAEDQLQAEAIASARRANPPAGDLVATIASRRELDNLRADEQQHRQRRES